MSRLVVSVVAGIALIGRANAEESAAYQSLVGPVKVHAVEKLVLHDAARDKDLQLRVNYPDAAEAPGPWPLIVFSHGAFGSQDNYRPLVDYWTARGYVTIQPTHSDSRSLGVRPGDPNAFQDWQSRPADISFVLDSLDEIEKQTPELKDRIDRKRVGVGGHSFGANTAQLVGGARAFPRGGTGAEKSFADSRVTAILIMSGQGPGEMLTEKSWEKFALPLLVMGGTKDGPTRTGQPAEWRKKPYELSPAGDKYLIWVDGLDHGYGGVSGANFSGRNQTNADHVRYTQISTLAFWDAYLKNSTKARDYLNSERLSTLSGGAIHLEKK